MSSDRIRFKVECVNPVALPEMFGLNSGEARLLGSEEVFGYDSLDESCRRIFVVGVNQRGPVQIGDVFSGLFEEYFDGDQVRKSVMGQRVAVSIIVEKILAYGRDIHEIASGYTAGLLLSGSGIEFIRIDSVLID